MTIDEDILVELFKESKMPIDKAIETIAHIASHRRNILNRFEREACANVIDTMRKYQQLQADYENRLKADLVAMLTEIQLEIEEIKPLEPTDDEDWQYGCFHGLELMQDKCLKLIQQKINSLKEA